MKTQMRFQKTLLIVSLVIAAICTVFAWMFCSGVFANITLILDKAGPWVTELYEVSQQFTTTFQILGIIFILVIVLQFIMGCHSRRKYYITNYIAVGIAVAYMLVYAIILLISLSNVSSTLAAIDFSAEVIVNDVNQKVSIEAYYNSLNSGLFGRFQTTSWTIPCGYVLAVLVIINAVVIALNLVWKIMLMKGEKKLLESGLVKEVA